MRHLDITDRDQGVDANDRHYGYCGITDRGGQFFTWHSTLADTLESIEDDETDPPENWPHRAYQEVRGFVRRAFAAERQRGYRGLIPSR